MARQRHPTLCITSRAGAGHWQPTQQQPDQAPGPSTALASVLLQAADGCSRCCWAGCLHPRRHSPHARAPHPGPGGGAAPAGGQREVHGRDGVPAGGCPGSWTAQRPGDGEIRALKVLHQRTWCSAPDAGLPLAQHTIDVLQQALQGTTALPWQLCSTCWAGSFGSAH